MTLSKKLKLIALFLILAQAVSGCAVIKNEVPTASGPEISYGPLADGQTREVVRTFETKGRVTYWLLYLIPKNRLNGYELARRELKDGEAVQNLKVTTQYDIVDFFVGFVSIVFGTWRIKAQGEIVKA